MANKIVNIIPKQFVKLYESNEREETVELATVAHSL